MYPLSEDSVVVDVGGYMGTWSQQIRNRYNCNIHIFEPVRSYRVDIERRFRGCPKIAVNPYGLSDRSSQASIAVRGDASTVLVESRR